MSSKKTNTITGKHSLVNFPEEVDKVNKVKIYGETSYENQMAVLSQYLHNSGNKISKKKREEITQAIYTFLERKKCLEEFEDVESLVSMAAENPSQ